MEKVRQAGGLDMPAHTCIPSCWKMETDQEIKVILGLHSEFEASLDYL